MFRFPPPHGCLPPAGGGGPGFTALLPVAGKSWGRSAGVVSVSRSFTLRFPPPHGASPPAGGGGLCGGVDEEVGGCLPPAGGGGPGFTAPVSPPRFHCPLVSPPSCPWRGSPGVDRLGRSRFHTPFPSTPPTVGTLAPTTGATETIRGGLPSYMPSDSGRKNLNSPRARPRFTAENRCANWAPGRLFEAPVFPKYSQKVT